MNKKTTNKDREINITPVLEHILGVSKIDNEKDARAMIAALREIGDEPLLRSDNLAKLMESFKKKK